MPPKPRDFYTTEFTGRDFFWFSPGGSSAPRNPRHRTGPKSRSSSVARSVTHRSPSVRKPPSMFGVSKRPRRAKMASIVEESPDLYMTPAIVTTPPSEPSQQPEPDSKKPPGPWSEWYETRDQTRFWRARKLPDDTWTYEYSPTNPSANSKQTTNTKPKPNPGSNRSLASFFFGIPVAPPPSTTPQIRPLSIFPPPPHDTSPDEAASTATSSSTGSASPHLNIPQPRSSGTTFPSFVSTGKGKGSSLSILSSSERVSTLSRHEEDSTPSRHLPTKGKGSKGASNKASPRGKPTLTVGGNGPGAGGPGGKSIKPNGGGSKSRAAATTIISLSLSKPSRPKVVPGAGTGNGNGSVNVKENTKKLHNKVKNEKELRIDTKKRVKGWLKDVVPEVVQSEWDEQGLPVYK
ncbi:hypothetical protein B0T14DRAFT_492725 [Immersiella caudata]|uniref:Uncharacterized protein n=1 Tax=Immersiella caudata TaxID=314043 RepID=A0AA40C5Y8_9PEZI|nr:hypothetical protein B0T14DRAFT_492725 [Immersiella caudata]